MYNIVTIVSNTVCCVSKVAKSRSQKFSSPEKKSL